MARRDSHTVGNRAFSIAALVVIGAGFWWRLLYLVRISLFIDEFTTILAAQMILKSGIPRLPSGLFYDFGLLFNYTVSVFIGLAGFGEAVARFPSVCFGLLAVAVTYRLGKRAFSPGAALVAAILLAMMPEAVVWGGRARPYAQLQFWVMVGMWAMVEGITTQWRGRWRALYWLAMTAAALSHLVGVVFMLGSLMAALLARCLWAGWGRRGRTEWRRQLRSLWPDGLLAIIVLGGTVALAMAGRPVWLRPVSGPASATEGFSLSRLLHPDWMNLLELVAPVTLRAYYLPWTIMLLANLCFLLYRAATRRLRRSDAIPLYLHGVWFSSVVALTLGSPWHVSRYILPLVPMFFLLGSYEMIRAVSMLIPAFRHVRAGGRLWLAVAILVLVGASLWVPLRQVTTEQEYGYDIALRHVRDHWQEGDAVMTFNTSGSYVYLGRCDYYPIQITPWLLDTPAGLVERYSGAQWVASVEQMDAALAESPRTWLVIDDERFLDRMTPDIQGSIVARFRSVFAERGVQVFLYER